MEKRTTYHVGGFLPDAAEQNRAAEWDGDAGTFTAWDASGVVVESRALTGAELADLAPAPVDPLAPVGDLAPSNGDLRAAVSTVEKALDPAQVDPTTATRVAALEKVVAALVARVGG